MKVPDDLAELDQWLLWRYEERNNRRTKVPYQANGHRADPTDPSTWTTFDIAHNRWSKAPQHYAGVGFVLSTNDPFSGIDLDDSLDADCKPKPWARGIVGRFSDSYMEVSPSGQGLKIWAKGSLPANLPGVKVGDGQIELYDHARYFAVTGRVFRGAPLQIEDHASDLRVLYHRLTNNKRSWPLQPLPGGRIPYGQQHSTLVSIAGTLRARRVCDEAIEACLQVINAKQCERPGPVANISQIVRSSRKWGCA
jgi:primase-polymerase (primpol)-like protein